MQRIIYFDEKQHKYTDDLGNAYTSVTTVIDKYAVKFDTMAVSRACERIGRNPNHKDYLKYRDKSASQIRKEWKKTSDDACDRGNIKHNFLDDAVKHANGYKRIENDRFIYDRIHTIADILVDPDYGVVDLGHLIERGVEQQYPEIYRLIEAAVNSGYRLYSEIGTFNFDHLVSGLVDLLLVRDKDFLIVDWKTNKADIRYEAGYFRKDKFNNLTDDFIVKAEYFKPPLQKYACSVGYKYTFQLSMYDYLIEGFGYTCKGNILCHIRHEVYNLVEARSKKDESLVGKPKVDILPIGYLKDDVELMLKDHSMQNTAHTQKRLPI